jgi:hypothetical protein
MLSTKNPWMLGIKWMAPVIKNKRLSRQDNQLLNQAKNSIEHIENQMTNWLESMIQLISTTRDAGFELAFHHLYGGLASTLPQHENSKNPVALKIQTTHTQSLNDGKDSLRQAVVRMVLLLIKARGGMRGAHLITFKNMIESNPIFKPLNKEQRESLLAYESALVSDNHELALFELPQLLKTNASRLKAMSLLEVVVGKSEQLSALPRNMMNRIYEILFENTKPRKSLEIQ